MHAIAESQPIDFGGQRVPQIAVAGDDPVKIGPPGARAVRRPNQRPMILFARQRRGVDGDRSGGGGAPGNESCPPISRGGGGRAPAPPPSKPALPPPPATRPNPPANHPALD